MEKKLILQNEVAEISKLAIFIEELGEEFGLSPELVFNLNLVLEEAVSNVILYAYPKEEHQTISLIARKKDNQLIFVLTDSGKEFDPTQAPDADITLSAEEREIGGLGIFITKKTMDTVRYAYENGENILTMIKKI